MANEEETKTKRAAEEPVEIKPDYELRRPFCASKPVRYRKTEDIEKSE
ncbi:MAG: hypothetical protein K8R25_00370 [Methanosarcinales archaeon]|nr:hypothetical protein [Methanosarcinales archaeon]